MTTIETYIPFYRKYRPQAFADLVGQTAIAQTLENAITHQKVAHAYLFCGPRGTGKTSTARIFAKSLNCEHGPTITPCQTCASCEGVTRGNALDVVEFDAASNNSVENARELIENAQFAPLSGRYKVYIIDEVHMLSSQAFNALLKTLEEPPPNVVFIFATTEAHKVLPTIISRCQRFDFSRITTTNIEERLKNIAEREAITIEPEALQLIARHAKGGMRDALGLLDQVSVMGRGNVGVTITPADVFSFIGALGEEMLVQLADLLAGQDAAGLLQQLDGLAVRGVEATQLIKELTEHFRHLLIVKAAGAEGTAEAMALSQAYFEQLQEQASRFEAEELPQIITRFSLIDRSIRASQEPQLWLEVGLLDIAFRQEIYQLKTLSERVETLEKALASGTVPMSIAASSAEVQEVLKPPAKPSKSVKPPADKPPFASSKSSMVQKSVSPVLETSPDLSVPPSPALAVMPHEPAWEKVCDMIASPPTKSLVKQQTFLIKVDADSIQVGCTSEAILGILQRPDKLIHLQKAVEKYFGSPLRLDLRFDKPGAGPVNADVPASAEPPSAPVPEQTMGSPLPVAVVPTVQEISAEPESHSPPFAETPPPLSEAEQPEWEASKKMAMDLLQGKVLE